MSRTEVSERGPVTDVASPYVGWTKFGTLCFPLRALGSRPSSKVLCRKRLGLERSRNGHVDLCQLHLVRAAVAAGIAHGLLYPQQLSALLLVRQS